MVIQPHYVLISQETRNSFEKKTYQKKSVYWLHSGDPTHVMKANASLECQIGKNECVEATDLTEWIK